MSFKRSINKVNTYKMTQSTLFNIFIKPYVVELIYDNELMMYVLTVFLYENDEFTILYTITKDELEFGKNFKLMMLIYKFLIIFSDFNNYYYSIFSHASNS